MAVYRKKLVDKDGNTIIPAVGDIYGTVYEATLSTATAGGRADYEFTPDTPVENNRVYAVKFPDPTVNNATIILGDGVVSGSILVPPVSATDSPNYELLTTDMINNTEPLLLMYNGVQWVCLNQKNKVATADLGNNAVSANNVNWATFIKTGTVRVEYQANNTSGGFVNVTFDTPFTNTPVVFAQDLLANGSVSSVTVSKVTNTGFRVLARTTNNSSSGTANVNWLAFSQQG